MPWFEELKEKYPDMFNGPRNCGYGCGDGWSEIVTKLTDDIAALGIKNLHIDQIKEKFGGLRYYISTHRTPEEYQVFTEEHKKQLEVVYKLINEAEIKSLQTCENCGSPSVETKSSSGWIATLCEPCRNQRENDRKMRRY